jgi:hypothetical protein
MSAQGTASACAARLRSPHRNQLRSWVTEGGGYAPGIPIRVDECGPLNAILPLPTDSEAFLWWRLRDEYPDGVIMTAVVIALSPAYRADRSPPPQDLDHLIVGLGHRIRYAMTDAMLAECFLRWPHPALCLCPLSPMPRNRSFGSSSTDKITADCPRKQAMNLGDPSGARCPDLRHLALPAD